MSATTNAVLILASLIGALNFGAAVYYETNLNPLQRKTGRVSDFGGPWKFLTFINLWVQLAFHLLHLLSTFLPAIKRARDLFFESLAFPAGMLVAVMFWSLYAIDRELVYPEIIDKYVPVAVNHMEHSVMVPLILLHSLLWRMRPCNLALSLAITAAGILAYLGWILYIGYTLDLWVYPILNELAGVQFGAFIGGAAVVGIALNVCGRALQIREADTKVNDYRKSQ